MKRLCKFVYQFTIIFNPKLLILTTISQIVNRRGLSTIKLLLYLLILQTIRGLFCWLYPLSNRDRVLMFDYFYLNNLPNHLNAYASCALAMSLNLFHKLYFVEFTNDYVVLPYKVVILGVHSNCLIKKHFRGKSVVWLMQKLADLIIPAHFGFYLVVCKWSFRRLCLRFDD